MALIGSLLLISMSALAQPFPPPQGGVQYLAPNQSKFVYDPQINQYITLVCGNGHHPPPPPPQGGCRVVYNSPKCKGSYQIFSNGHAMTNCWGDYSSALSKLQSMIQANQCPPAFPAGSCDVRFDTQGCPSQYQLLIGGYPATGCWGDHGSATGVADYFRKAGQCY